MQLISNPEGTYQAKFYYYMQNTIHKFKMIINTYIYVHRYDYDNIRLVSHESPITHPNS